MEFLIFKENCFGKVTDVSEFIRFQVFSLFPDSPHNAQIQTERGSKNGLYAVREDMRGRRVL